MFMKKKMTKEEKDLHFKQAVEITKTFFCKNCREKEGSCRESYSDIPQCYTFGCVMNRIKKIFDRFDR